MPVRIPASVPSDFLAVQRAITLVFLLALRARSFSSRAFLAMP
jgi:hypothetical protein